MNRQNLFGWTVVSVCWIVLTAPGRAVAEVKVFPAPKGAALTTDFIVTVDGQSSPVHRAMVGPADEKKRWLAMDDPAQSADLFDLAAFTTFDVDGPVAVEVTFKDDVHSVKVLPSSAGITPDFIGRKITIPLTGPANLTVEVNDDQVHSLHLFANPVQTNVPTNGDDTTLFYGPGVHDVPKGGIVVGAGQTLYLAGGAVLKATEGGSPVVWLKGDHATLRGRGIIDGTGAPTHSRSLVTVQGSDDLVEGVILHDSAGWSMPVRECDRVTIRNVKIFSHRVNGDGIDLCNCRNALVEGCFVRTLDDCIVVKAFKDKGVVSHNLIQKCVLWNQVAHALSVGAELRESVDDVRFTDCDVIHDTGREWTLRVYHCDSAPVTHISFDHIRVEQSRRLASVWIGKTVWSKDDDRGHVTGVTFSDITAVCDSVNVALHGFDAGHLVDDVKFEHVSVNGKSFGLTDLKQNDFVHAVTVSQ